MPRSSERAPRMSPRATAWLRSQGLSVGAPSRTGTRLAFSGTAAQVERAFGTEMHYYLVDGAKHFAMSRAPSVPADLADIVLGLHNLHDFRPPAPPHAPQYSLPLPTQDGGTVNYPSLAPADFAKIYGLDSVYANHITGKGQHIAIAGQTDFNDADIAAFRKAFALATNAPVRHLVPDSGSAVVLDQGDLTETELDLEWSGAVAQDATIDFVFTGDNSAGGVFDAMLYAIEQHIAPILSVSYGSPETGLTPSDAVFDEALGDAAALQGITVLAASGDTGAAGGDSQRSTSARRGLVVGLPASIPTVVAVGGSQFQLTKGNLGMYLDSKYNALGYIPESGWNETAEDIDAGAGGLGSGGGGVSKVFAKPYWQIPFTPNDNFRDVPDVALTASAAILPYIVSYSWTVADGDAMAPQAEALTVVGGTSAATPSFAGILALVNQSLAAAHPSAPVGLGNANPVLDALANSATTKNAFNDITTGDNIVPCTQGSPDCPSTAPFQFGYSCAAGYDQVTGLGSVNAGALVTAWSALTPTSTTLNVSASGMTEGSPLMLTATVASTATTNALSGSVTFYFETFDAMGNVDLSGTLGAATITPSATSAEGGTATLMAKAPAGLLQADAGLMGGAKIGAVYGGDTHYLASWSSLAAVTGTSNLSICPQSVTLEPTQTGFQFMATGGTAPISWTIGNDGTCARVNKMLVCSTIDDAGVFTAGPTVGTAEVLAFDSNEAYISATVTVAGTADGGAPLPAPCMPALDAGSDASIADGGGLDATMDAAMDAPGIEHDASEEGGSSSTSNGSCGCVAVGADSNAVVGGPLGLALMGLAAAGRRRRSRRTV